MCGLTNKLCLQISCKYIFECICYMYKKNKLVVFLILEWKYIKHSGKRWLTCLPTFTECQLNPFTYLSYSRVLLGFKPNAFVRYLTKH